jgi:hypothetical protein
MTTIWIIAADSSRARILQVTDRSQRLVEARVRGKFLGQLRKELGREVQKLVAEELPKDLSWLNARDIERHLANGRRST